MWQYFEKVDWDQKQVILGCSNSKGLSFVGHVVLQVEMLLVEMAHKVIVGQVKGHKRVSHLHGDMIAKWIVPGTLNIQVMGLNLSAASWFTM